MGLETLAASSQHIHLYQKLGFRPAWTGISYRGPVRYDSILGEVEIDGDAPSLDYIFPGFSAAKDAATTQTQKVGATLRLADGFAVCHVTSTLWADSAGYKPGGASLRMKRGQRAGYDAGDFYYCDDWH